jgi:hypothetical protein
LIKGNFTPGQRLARGDCIFRALSLSEGEGGGGAEMREEESMSEKINEAVDEEHCKK